MFFRFAALLPIVSLVSVATTAPNELEARADYNICSPGSSLQCCNKVISEPTPVKGTLGGTIVSVNSTVGLTCTSITVTNDGNLKEVCTKEAACCAFKTVNGVLSISCNPVTVTV